MKSLKQYLLALLAISLFSCGNDEKEPEAFGATPSKRQQVLQEMEYYAFVHFSMNTFTDIEWGYGDKDPKLFNPTELDCKQWAKVCKEAGMKGIILTAKHHDGFCLWPSKYTEYSVKNSPWRNGKGDLLRELREACDEYGLKMGVYLSPWDRNHAKYGTQEYITYMRNQLRELLTNYGEIFEVWFDGANGGSGYYGGAREARKIDRKTYYDWKNTRQIVRDLQPMANMFSDAGPDVRWVGNEEGYANKTNWCTLNAGELYPGTPRYKELTSGHEDGTHWVPTEVDVSIRPGWFYHKSEDHKVKSLPHLVDIYYHSVGRNGTLLMNLPVDGRGLVHETDVERLMQLRKTLDEDFKTDLAKGASIEANTTRGNSSTYEAENMIDGDKETYWATDDNVTTAEIVLDFGKPKTFNRFLAQEYTKKGQRVKQFKLEVEKNGKWVAIANETTIGYKRILRLETVTAQKIKFTIENSKACPLISNIQVFKAPKLLTEPHIQRDIKGLVQIRSHNPNADIYYTTDGSNPTANSTKYTAPFKAEKATVKAIEIDEDKKSPLATAEFDVITEKWRVVGHNNDQNAFDGNSHTNFQTNADPTPVDFVVDLGKVHSIKGFKYLPDQLRWSAGIIFNYEFYVSNSKSSWGKPVSKGEFSNIKNNPIERKKLFSAQKGRFVKLRMVSNTNGSKDMRIAEFGIVTK
jgi:alpha-L-fucosidase